VWWYAVIAVAIIQLLLVFGVVAAEQVDKHRRVAGKRRRMEAGTLDASERRRNALRRLATRLLEQGCAPSDPLLLAVYALLDESRERG
jgi:hypothetical protein